MLRVSRSLVQALVVVVAATVPVACIPEPSPDAGTDAGADVEDDGGVVHDAGVRTDAGPPPADAGETSCPTIAPGFSPVGTACSVECQQCGQDGCIAPGTGCVFIRCQQTDDGLVWVRLTGNDAPSSCDPDAGTATDAGTDAGTAADAGATTDAGTDAGATTDAGTDAGATTDAGTDAGTTTDAGDADGGALADAGDAGPDAG